MVFVKRKINMQAKSTMLNAILYLDRLWQFVRERFSLKERKKRKKNGNHFPVKYDYFFIFHYSLKESVLMIKM
jgi:hypothetical protein